MSQSNVDYRLLTRAKERDRAVLREIQERGAEALVLTLLGVGTAVFFGGLAITFSILYAMNMVMRVMSPGQ